MTFDDLLSGRELKVERQVRDAYLQDKMKMGEGMTHLRTEISPIGGKGGASCGLSFQSDPGHPSIPPNSPLSGRRSSNQSPSEDRAR